MNPAVDRLATVRERRARRAQAAALLASVQSSGEPSSPLGWSMLLDVPEWCHWPSARREHLVLIAGALFAAPAMRLWIEARRIEAARAVIGADVFERVMAHESVPRETTHIPAGEDIRVVFQAAGAAVLLGSLAHECLRDWLAPLLPPSAGTLSQVIATALAADAQALMVSLPPEESS